MKQVGNMFWGGVSLVLPASGNCYRTMFGNPFGRRPLHQLWYLVKLAYAGETPAKRRALRSSLFALSLLALGAVGGLLSVSFPSAMAMGAAPSTCNNRYDGTITSFLVSYPGGTLDPIAHPNGTFTLYGDATYSVTFTIHNQGQSSSGNTLGGTSWYNENLYGYYFGNCYPSQTGTSVGPNQDVSVTMAGITHPCCESYTVYQIVFSTLTGSQQTVAFKINWQPAATTSTISATPTTATTAASVISTTSPSTISTVPAATTILNTSQTALATSSPASSSSSSNRPDPTSSLTTAAGANPLPAPSLTVTDVLAMTGLGIAGAFAFGWAMLRRLR